MAGGRTTHKDFVPLLNDEMIERICNCIRGGAYIETAAAFCGISKVIFYRWLKIGNKTKEGLEWKLVNAVDRAMAEAEMRDIQRIDDAIEKGAWAAAAWRLERKHPERWGRKDRLNVEHTGEGGGPIKLAAMSREEMRKKIVEVSEEMVKKLAEPDEI